MPGVDREPGNDDNAVMRKQIAFLALAVATVTGAGCSGGGSHPDDRPWFLTYVQRAEDRANVFVVGTPEATSYALISAGPPYVGRCANHRADATWQASIPSQALGAHPTTEEIKQTSLNVSGLLLTTSGLASSRVQIVSPSANLQQTIVLKPNSNSRLQVTVPFAQSVLIAGYLSC
ncbi:MAG: hypothetical protein JWM76_2287 [Pseudonocardiales bacterium]|nr:hypothetical protein [Pseudonocardiales bacterium]